MEFTHLNSDGAAHMVDVTEKQPTVRTATAEGEVACSPEVMTAPSIRTPGGCGTSRQSGRRISPRCRSGGYTRSGPRP